MATASVSVLGDPKLDLHQSRSFYTFTHVHIVNGLSVNPCLNEKGSAALPLTSSKLSSPTSLLESDRILEQYIVNANVIVRDIVIRGVSRLLHCSSDIA
jgi:hypothetical protein